MPSRRTPNDMLQYSTILKECGIDNLNVHTFTELYNKSFDFFAPAQDKERAARSAELVATMTEAIHNFLNNLKPTDEPNIKTIMITVGLDAEDKSVRHQVEKMLLESGRVIKIPARQESWRLKQLTQEAAE